MSGVQFFVVRSSSLSPLCCSLVVFPLFFFHVKVCLVNFWVSVTSLVSCTFGPPSPVSDSYSVWRHQKFNVDFPGDWSVFQSWEQLCWQRMCHQHVSWVPVRIKRDEKFNTWNCGSMQWPDGHFAQTISGTAINEGPCTLIKLNKNAI